MIQGASLALLVVWKLYVHVKKLLVILKQNGDIQSPWVCCGCLLQHPLLPKKIKKIQKRVESRGSQHSPTYCKNTKHFEDIYTEAEGVIDFRMTYFN